MKKILLLLLFSLLNNFLSAQGVFTPEFMWSLGRVSEIKLSPDGSMVLFGISNYNIQENSGNRNLFVIDTKTGKQFQLTDLPGSEYNAVWKPDGKKIMFINKGTIYETDASELSKPKAVSEQFDNIVGFKISPKLDKLIIVRRVKLDKTALDLHPDLPKANALIFDDLMYRHWDDWTDYSYNHIFIADFKNGAIGNMYDIMEGKRFHSPVPTDGDMEDFSWHPDGNKFAYVTKLSTGKDFAVSTNTDVFIYDIESGISTNISDGILGYDKEPAFSPDGSKLVWNSMATAGFESDKKRIMVFDFITSERKDYSSEFDQSSTNFQWANDNEILFISGIDATFQIFKLTLNSGKISKITDGWHDYRELEYKNGILLGAKMSMTYPTEIFKVDLNSGTEYQLSYINSEKYKSIKTAKIEQRWVNTTDNKKMLVWVIYPPNFDENKKYPAILYCQGGPQSAVSQFFSFRWNFQMMAANDYIIVAPNRRGLPSFGQEWNNQISQDYGGQNMLDYFSAIDSISNLPCVDKNRLGAVGASYGGFSVYWLAGNHQGRFKTFIAHCGMFNFESWYGSTEEMWFANYDLGGAFWEEPTPKSYSFSPHKFIAKWNTPILVIHGGYDFRIPYTEGMQAFNAAQLKGIPSRFLFFPDETHFVSKPQNSILWQREFFKWLDKWLK